jgi:hypothetical protein
MHLERQGSKILNTMTCATVSLLPWFNGVSLFTRFKGYWDTKTEG